MGVFPSRCCCCVQTTINRTNRHATARVTSMAFEVRSRSRNRRRPDRRGLRTHRRSRNGPRRGLAAVGIQLSPLAGPADRSGRLGHLLFGTRLGHRTRSRPGAATRSSSRFPADFARVHSPSRARSLSFRSTTPQATCDPRLHAAEPLASRWNGGRRRLTRIRDRRVQPDAGSSRRGSVLASRLQPERDLPPVPRSTSRGCARREPRARDRSRSDSGIIPYFRLPGVSDPDIGGHAQG